MNEIPRYFDIILMDRQLEQYPPYFTRKAVRVIRLVSSLFAFFMNLFFIFFLDKSYNAIGENGETKATELSANQFLGDIDSVSFMKYLGITQIILSSVVLIMLIRNRREVVSRDFWRRRFYNMIHVAKARKSRLHSNKSRSD